MPCLERAPSSPILKILPSASSRICETCRPCGLKACGGDLVAHGDELAQDRALANDLA
jgi:hypothetical protein